jgi:Domain of unknown function (DUF932)
MYHAQQQPLSRNDLVKLAPAVFAERARETRSNRYVHIPTMVLLDTLERVGFKPYQVNVAKVRHKMVADERGAFLAPNDRDGYQKHLVRLRHTSNLSAADGGVPELVMVNAHDGSSAFHMMAGFFEFLCANGLMIGSKDCEFTVRHSGNEAATLREVAEGARMMLTHLARIPVQRAEFLDVKLTWDEQRAFAKSALQLRYGGEDEQGKPKPIPLEPHQILRPRREAEYGDTATVHGRTVLAPRDNLWSTFNVCQEHLIRGGQIGKSQRRGRITTRKQRGVNGIDQNIAINRALWTLADEMKKLKS